MLDIDAPEPLCLQHHTTDTRRPTPIHCPIPASCCCKLPSLHPPPSPATLAVFQPALRVQFGAPRSSRPAVARRHHISPRRRGARMIPNPPSHRLYIVPFPPLLIDSANHLSPPNGEPPTFLHTTHDHPRTNITASTNHSCAPDLPIFRRARIALASATAPQPHVPASWRRSCKRIWDPMAMARPTQRAQVDRSSMPTTTTPAVTALRDGGPMSTTHNPPMA